MTIVTSDTVPHDGDTAIPLGPPPLPDDSDYPLEDPYSDSDDYPDTDDVSSVRPSTWDELRTANPSLYNRARVAGFVRSASDPTTLLARDDMTTLTDYLTGTPTAPLPQPRALDVDVAATVTELLRGFVRYYRNVKHTKGGTVEWYTSDGWKTVGDDQMDALIASLIHPTPHSVIPQLIRPVKAVKLKVSDVVSDEADGLVVLNSDGRIVLKGTDIVLTQRYVPAEEYTGNSLTLNRITQRVLTALLDSTPLDMDVEDPDRWTIHTQNGFLIELSKREMVDPEDGSMILSARPATRADLVSRRTRADWNVDLASADRATWCPEWEEFVRGVASYLDTATGTWVDRPDLVKAIQTFLGACLLPIPAADRFALFHGDHGNNGKSWIVDIFAYVLGHAINENGYAHKLNASAISKLKGSEPHPTDLVGLIGSRIGYIHEMNPRAWDGERAKRLCNDIELSARGMFENFQTVPRTSNLLVTSNDVPQVANDNGFWKRAAMFPCEARWWKPDDTPDLIAISIGPADEDLKAKLFAEADGILLWCLEGLFRFHTEGFVADESMQETKRDAREIASEWTDWVFENIVCTGDDNDVLDDKLVHKLWSKWNSSSDSMGNFAYPYKSGDIQKALGQIFPTAVRRGRGVKGTSRGERNGFARLAWTSQAVREYGSDIAQYSAKMNGDPLLNGINPLNRDAISGPNPFAALADSTPATDTDKGVTS